MLLLEGALPGAAASPAFLGLPAAAERADLDGGGHYVGDGA